jgi:hypothetical protein
MMLRVGSLSDLLRHDATAFKTYERSLFRLLLHYRTVIT